jgi:hypothetical protein
LALLLLVLLAGKALAQDQGQTPPPPIVFPEQDAVTTSFVSPTNLGGSGTASSDDSNQWLKVEFQYAVNPPAGANFLDEVQFKVWIEGRDTLDPAATTPEGIAITLTGSVTYVNVAKTATAYGVFYVHPSTLGRYSTSRGVSDFDRKWNIHIEADVDGKPVASVDKNKEQDPNWYLPPVRPVPGYVYRQNQSPFVNADSDKYPAIKLPEDK